MGDCWIGERVCWVDSAVAEAKAPCGERGSEVSPLRASVDPVYGLWSVGSRLSGDLWMWKAGGFTASLWPFLLGPPQLGTCNPLAVVQTG